MEKALIIGASGSLGTQLIKDLSNDFEVVGTGTYNEHWKENLIHLNITNKKEVSTILKRENPDLVLIAAAKTDVEACELDPKGTMEVNVRGIENILDNCKNNQKIIFYSTDNVFDGTKKSYREEDAPNPINVYGRSKLEGEKLIRAFPNHLICRSSRYYGEEKDCPKFLNKIINLLAEGKNIEAPVESDGNFTFIPDISRATLELIKKNRKGTYHVAGPDAYSLYSAALKVVEIFSFNRTLVFPTDKDHFNIKVKRPACVLDTAKLAGEGIKMSTLEEGLEKIKNFYM